MYYNSNKKNNDYYSSYRQEIKELEAYDREEKIEKIIKFILFLLGVILFLLASFYIYRYFYPTNSTAPTTYIGKKTEKQETPPKIVISESELPISPQLVELSEVTTQNITQETNTISPKDIALIVQIIMSQLNNREELPLEEQLKNVERKKFVTKNIKESNHYNKVILPNDENNIDASEIQNPKLVELTKNINNLLNDQGSKVESNYKQAISKEIVDRTNEMRVIIVKPGDTLSSIAKRAYGDYDAYPKIFSANPEIIKNPDQIFVGQRLRIPS